MPWGQTQVVMRLVQLVKVGHCGEAETTERSFQEQKREK